MKEIIQSNLAPGAIGSYSPGIKVGSMVFLSGQIPLDPETMELVQGGIQFQVERVLKNIQLLANQAGGSLDSIVKLTVYLMDLSHINFVNDAIQKFFRTPFPARTSIGVAALPKGSLIEVDAVLML